MRQVTLHIENSRESRDFVLEDEVTIGRTDLSTLVVADSGLSRKNTTIFRDGDAVLVADEGSLNGTFLKGQKIEGPPQELRNGDEIKIGSETRIRVEFSEEREREKGREGERENQIPKQTASGGNASVNERVKAPSSNKSPMILIVAALMTFGIIFVGLIAFLIVSRSESDSNTKPGKPTSVIIKTSLIPVRVIDPLGGEDEDDLDDLIASWEVEEKEIDAGSVADVSVSAADTADADLNVTAAFLADRQKKAFEPRSGETGIRPAGLDVPKELFGDGVVKQKRKLAEMRTAGYQQPLDFAELAEKRLKKDLIEMPMATKSFYLDVGGSASDAPFQSFSFQNGNADIQSGSPKYQILAQLSSNFAGQKYDLNNPADRKQMRIRLLRMFNSRAKPILQELADVYFAKFNRPLRVTSLTRSMDYQIGLNQTNANSFKVRGEGSLPPHTSGCAFDLARKHMTAEEQNFVMRKLAEMEASNKLDALIEYGANACFHIFIYFDGNPPRP